MSAPSGEVDKVLSTVVNNLIVINDLDIQPEVRARVLLTAPLESFTIGHTIVVSRGLLDVLPDEASLAMVLARELSHIALDHQLDTKFAFSDRMVFAEEDTFSTLNFKRSTADEMKLTERLSELLANSPYKDKLGNAGLFSRLCKERAPDLGNHRARLGDGLVSGKTLRMSNSLNGAPQLDERKKDPIPHCPWVDESKWILEQSGDAGESQAGGTSFGREKMPFKSHPFSRT